MFKVDPEALRLAANSYATTAEHLRFAGHYHREPSQIDFNAKGIIFELKGGHDGFVALLQERLDTAAANLLQSAIELEKAAAAYVSTDTGSAGRLDATVSVAVTAQVGELHD
jgi:Excreted virulence factor EspC, type VII ESX diderm